MHICILCYFHYLIFKSKHSPARSVTWNLLPDLRFCRIDSEIPPILWILKSLICFGWYRKCLLLKPYNYLNIFGHPQSFNKKRIGRNWIKSWKFQIFFLAFVIFFWFEYGIRAEFFQFLESNRSPDIPKASSSHQLTA